MIIVLKNTNFKIENNVMIMH